MAPTLLGTKLHAPRRRRGVVARPRLTDRLTGSALPAVTVVAAPAGFGKTTLLADACGESRPGDCRVAWLSLDARDNDPTVFWSYVIAAVQAAVGDVGADSLTLLQSGQPAETVVASLLNDLAAVEDDVVLVLDDYHVIDTASIHETVAFAVEYLPAHVHLVLGARSDPPLPVARWRARGDLLEIRASDLRFNPDESAAYLNDEMGLGLDAADVEALDGRTEGWIAALQLAALSLQGRDDTGGFIATFTGDDRFVVDYLVEEVLERQPDDVRTFLLQTAIIDRFSAPLCDAVTDRNDSKAMLDRLDRANLFLVPLDDRRVWYRYHHLFADVLRARLLDEDPEHVAVLHRRACDWHADRNESQIAINHALAGRDVDRAAELIEIAAPSARRRRQEGTLRFWLESLPDDVFVERPVLAITLAGARMATGDATGVARLLDGIQESLQQATPPPVYIDDEQFDGLAAQVEIYRAALALLSGDVDTTISHATTRSTSSSRPITCAEAARLRFWRSPIGPPAVSTPRWRGTSRRSTRSPLQGTSPTCSAAHSRSPTSSSCKDDSTTQPGSSNPVFDGPPSTPGCEERRTCTSGSARCSSNATTSTAQPVTSRRALRSATPPGCPNTPTGGESPKRGSAVPAVTWRPHGN